MNGSAKQVVEAVRACRSVFLGVGLLSMVINLLMLTGPIFMLQIYDRVLTSRSIPTLVALAGIAAGLYAFFGLLETIRSRILTRVGARLDDQLSGVTFKSAVTLPLIGGRQADRIEPVRDLETTRQFLAGPGPSAIFDMPWLPLYIAIVFLFHPVLGLIAAGGACIIALLIGLNEALVRRPLGDASGQAAKRTSLVEGARANAESVAAMGMMDGLLARWTHETAAFLSLQGKAADRAAIFSSLIKTFRFLLQSAILGGGAYLAIHEAITPGVMIASSIVTARAVAPIEQAVGQWRAFVGARQAFRRLEDVLGKVSSPAPATQLPLPTKSLTVEGLTVVPPGGNKPIVKSIDLALENGQIMGLIGPSSSGKSTLGKALVGVWPASRGVVRFDGFDLNHWDASRLGNAIGYLPQDIQLLAGSVAENIARFRPEATSQEVMDAAQAAGAHEIIARLPDGYDTQVGDGGAVLSGGQRQRIALARALFGDPFIVVLDEPNSNLDAEGEAALTQALQGIRKRKGIAIVIAHRPSAITAVDTLMVLRDGEVNAFGPKDEVLKGANAVASGDVGGGLKVVGDA
ncbi:type I secretion system permease/ATPase [Hwanghaeella sp.]|uniref:type I secretion system permease/ATPase n=1 Tax=Hwanghaeella sp. TaxID=2605943 RepID=UPI003CCC20B2